MRRRCHLEQTRARFVPLHACDRSVRRPLRAGQYPGPEAFPQKRPHYPSVRDDDDARTAGAEGADGREGVLEPRDDLLVGLGAHERPAFLLRDREELLCQLGVALLLLGPGVAFEDASIPLGQAFDGDDLARESRTVADDLCGLEGARERAGVQAFERLAGEAASCKARLHSPFLRERELHLALPDAFGVRRGLSVTHQEQLLWFRHRVRVVYRGASGKSSPMLESAGSWFDGEAYRDDLERRRRDARRRRRSSSGTEYGSNTDRARRPSSGYDPQGSRRAGRAGGQDPRALQRDRVSPRTGGPSHILAPGRQGFLRRGRDRAVGQQKVGQGTRQGRYSAEFGACRGAAGDT